MNRLATKMAIGSVCVLGLALASAMAQHDGHGDHGNHEDGSAGHTAALPNCPVMDEPINLAVSTATDDGPVFFCCKGCIPKYKADPAKYATKVAAQRKALADRAKIQVTCPVSKKPVDEEFFIDGGGKKVYFCCAGCLGKYKRDPSKYAATLANSYTYQTTCPVMNEEINPTVFTTTANGTNVYFCCKGCDKKFTKNPGKYAASLVAQGFTVDPKGMTRAADDHSDHDHGDHDHSGHDHGH